MGLSLPPTPRTGRVGRTSGKTRRLPSGPARRQGGSRTCPFRAGFAPPFPLVLPPSRLPPPGSRPRWAGWAGPGETLHVGPGAGRGRWPGTPLSPPPRARIPRAPPGRTLERDKSRTPPAERSRVCQVACRERRGPARRGGRPGAADQVRRAARWYGPRSIPSAPGVVGEVGREARQQVTRTPLRPCGNGQLSAPAGVSSPRVHRRRRRTTANVGGERAAVPFSLR